MKTRPLQIDKSYKQQVEEAMERHADVFGDENLVKILWTSFKREPKRSAHQILKVHLIFFAHIRQTSSMQVANSVLFPMGKEGADRTARKRLMVVGIPNTGKSTLIKTLRERFDPEKKASVVVGE